MQEKLRLKNKPKPVVLLLTSLFALALVSPTLAAHATTTTVSSYSFNLTGPDTATAGATVPGTPIARGDILSLTGSGTFDSSKGTATGGGSFTHSKPDGTVFARGTWVVTGFQSFTAYGGPNSGHQGGLLLVTVTLFGPEATFAGLTMQISCAIDAPTGAPEEGTTLPGLFQDSPTGSTLFHLN